MKTWPAETRKSCEVAQSLTQALPLESTSRPISTTPSERYGIGTWQYPAAESHLNELSHSRLSWYSALLQLRS